jgi:vacuolar-type H+-ATPase subunit F/Vma7
MRSPSPGPGIRKGSLVRRVMVEMKVAMIGGRTSTAGFKALGVETYVAAAPEDGPAVWRTVPLERYGVIMVTEPVYQRLREEMPGFPAHEGLPVILVIPAVTGSLGIGRADIKNRVEKAVGAVIKS